MSHEGLIKRLREKAGCFDYDGRPDIACDYEQAADAIEGLNNLCMDLQGELKRTRSDYKQGKELQEELQAGLVEAIERIPHWIPVTEQLPEDFKAVLVYTPKYLNQFMAYRKDDGWRVWSPQDNHGVPFINGQGEITHWMPLPELPKKEQK